MMSSDLLRRRHSPEPNSVVRGRSFRTLDDGSLHPDRSQCRVPEFLLRPSLLGKCLPRGTVTDDGSLGSMSRLIIRERAPDDLLECVRVLQQVHRADGYPVVWPDDPVSWLSPPELFAAWVAECPDTGIGGHIALTTSGVIADEAGPDALVSRLFVPPAGRRRRVGRHLLDHAQKHATSMGKSLMLEVAELGDGAAIALYERSGWLHVTIKTATWTTPDGQPVSLRYYRPTC